MCTTGVCFSATTKSQTLPLPFTYFTKRPQNIGRALTFRRTLTSKPYSDFKFHVQYFRKLNPLTMPDKSKYPIIQYFRKDHPPTMSYLLQHEAHPLLLAASLAEASNSGGDLILVSAEGHRSTQREMTKKKTPPKKLMHSLNLVSIPKLTL